MNSLRHTGTDLAKKLGALRIALRLKKGRRTEQRRLGQAQREGWGAWTWVGDPEPHANHKNTGVAADNSHTTPSFPRAPPWTKPGLAQGGRMRQPCHDRGTVPIGYRIA